MAKLTRWTGEVIPAALVVSSAGWERVEGIEEGSRHVRSRSDDVDPLERARNEWEMKASTLKPSHAHSASAPPFDSHTPRPASPLSPSIPPYNPHRKRTSLASINTDDDSERETEDKSVRRTKKLSEFFGVAPSDLPPSLPVGAAEERDAFEEEGVRVKLGPAVRERRHAPSASVLEGRLSGMDTGELAVVMDKLRRLK